ncbi:hypothetical protein [Metaplanococcus flavidus]|uniref:Uncharacterized protein n=1 Tax=Metaplanococcus flavidus TaxID=569883 RepID=A0ABW3LAA6_9BACL
MHEDLKRKLDDSVPEDVTLSDTKKRQILKAAQEREGERRPTSVPKLLPALAGVAVIGLSGLFAYPYLMEETDAPEEIRNAEENEPSSIEGNDPPESTPPPVDEEPDENSEEETDETAEEDSEETLDESTDKEETLVEDSESQLLTKEEKFIALLNHEFYETGIELGDEVAEVESNYPNWLEKGEVEGGLATSYGSFMVIRAHFETKINHVNLREFTQLTVSQIEEVIGQKIEIVAYFNEILNREVISGEFILENKRYVVIADSEAQDAKVKEIWISAYSGG